MKMFSESPNIIYSNMLLSIAFTSILIQPFHKVESIDILF